MFVCQLSAISQLLLEIGPSSPACLTTSAAAASPQSRSSDSYQPLRTSNFQQAHGTAVAVHLAEGLPRELLGQLLEGDVAELIFLPHQVRSQGKRLYAAEQVTSRTIFCRTACSTIGEVVSFVHFRSWCPATGKHRRSEPHELHAPSIAC